MAYPCKNCPDLPVGYKCPKAKSCKAYQKHSADLQAAKEAENKEKEFIRFRRDVVDNGIRTGKGDIEHWRKKRMIHKRYLAAARIKEEEELAKHENEC